MVMMVLWSLQEQAVSPYHLRIISSHVVGAGVINQEMKAALEIRSLIQTLLKEHDSTSRISYIGGVFDHASHYILPVLNETIDNLISPIHTPEYGAYKLAKKLG